MAHFTQVLNNVIKWHSTTIATFIGLLYMNSVFFFSIDFADHFQVKTDGDNVSTTACTSQGVFVTSFPWNTIFPFLYYVSNKSTKLLKLKKVALLSILRELHAQCSSFNIHNWKESCGCELNLCLWVAVTFAYKMDSP